MPAIRFGRYLVAALTGGLFVAPILVALRATVPSTEQTSFVVEAADDRPVPIGLRGAPTFEPGGTFFVYQNQLTAADAAALAQYREIRLHVVAPEGGPQRQDGELVFTGTACRYRALDRGAGVTAGVVTFERSPGCTSLNGATGQVVLRLRYRTPAHPVLLAFVRAPAEISTIALRVSRFGLPAGSAVLVAEGTAVRFTGDPGATRLALLTYLWQIDGSGWWIQAAVVVAGVAIALAVLLLWKSPRPAATSLGRVSAAGFLAAVSLSGLYAVLTPPMQAADEPSHFLTLAEYLGDPALAAAADAWARRGHFEEIRFHPDRTFSPADRETPGRSWTGMGPASFLRGSGIQALWWLLTPITRHLAAPPLLLMLRLVSALVFAASVALFVFAVGRSAGADVADLLALPLFLVPTLPYFGMQMSNYGPLTSAYVALAAAVVMASWTAGGAAAGALLGSAFAIANILSRSAVPMVPCVAAVLLARALVGGARPSRPRWPFWLAVAVTAGVGIAIAREPYLAYLNMRESVGAQVAGVKRAVNASPWLAVPGVAAGWGLEAAVAAVRRRRSRAERRGTGIAVRWIAGAAAAALLLMVLGSLLVPYPRLNAIDLAHPPAIRSYVRHAVLACATSLRFGRPDTLTSWTFWGGFGWLDAVLPASTVELLAGSSGLALVLLLVWTARARDGRLLVWLACAAVGFVLSAAAYAVSVVALTPADLHGRYLLGLYLLALTIAWSSLARFERSGWLPASRAVRAAGGAAALALHAYSLVWGLQRYF